jgi:signal transduction histidine kinase
MSGNSPFLVMMVLPASLVLSACLLGLILEREKKRYGEAVVISRLARSAFHEPSLRSTIESTLISVREYFGADQVRLAAQEIRGEHGVAWESTRPTGNNGKGVQSWKLTEPARCAWFAMPPDGVLRRLEHRRVGADGRPRVRAARNRRSGTLDALVSSLPLFSAPTQHRDEIYDLRIASEQHSLGWGLGLLLATSFSFEGKWLGRLIVFNPRRRRDPSTDLRFLEAFVREAGPAIYSKYLVSRLRSRIQAMERGRLAQDLHDGVIQSLIALEVEIDLLRRTQAGLCSPLCPLQELGRLQELFHNEIANLREEMQRVKPLEVEPARLLDCMAGTVDRFRREQGISASFVAECQEVTLPPRVCTELVRIVQEALANVRKHSGAQKVLVRFSRENGCYKLCAEDDGRGFRFTGRLSSAELEASSDCPLVIKERVRAISGELMIESVPGSGSRLVILVPSAAHGRVCSND